MMQTIDSVITLKNFERELELCKKAGGDIERYRRLSLDVFQLEQIRLGLQHHVDVEKYLDPSLSWMEMESVRTALEVGINISKYTDRGYSMMQFNEIREGLAQGVDITKYADNSYLAPQMKQIRKGMVKKLDVKLYANQEFDWYQMREIRKGLEEGVDASLYAKPKYKHLVMRAVRKALLEGVNIISYAEQGYHGKALIELSRSLAAGNDIRAFLENGYHAEQLEQINNSYEQGVNILPYLSKEFHGTQLQEIMKGLKKGLDVSVYAKQEFNWFQMREIRFGMEDKVDVSEYAKPEFSYQQMAEIRKGLLAGVDVTEYAKIYNEPEQMAELRKKLEADATELSEEMEKTIMKTLLPQEERMDGGNEREKSEAAEESEETGQEYLLDACITVSADRMSAVINLSMMGEEAAKLVPADIMNSLNHHDVKQGILKKEIVDMLNNKVYDKDVVLAKGKAAQNGEDGKFIYYFRRELKRKPKVLGNGAVDYKNMELFEAVKKGQLLAEYQPATQGVFGYDITGQLISPVRGKELTPLHGQGFSMSEDKRKYYALSDGIVEQLENGDMEVRNMFNVPGNVDASVGNIDFKGDLNIMGNVEAGFKIRATGNVVIDGNCEGAVIEAGQDVVIRKGCLGQGNGVIYAGGNITGQFFESVKLVSDKDITASYLLNCEVKASGKLMVEGRKGVIIGGYICAKQGVSCFGLGNVAEIKTVVEVGIDKEDMEKYQELMKNLEKLDAEIKTLEGAVSKIMAQPERDEKTKNFCARLNKALYSSKTSRKQLLEERTISMDRLNRQRGARIVVSGSVYPGTKIYINSDSYQVKSEYTNVQFAKVDNQIEMLER